ncbi:acyl carrier protein [Variovorax paradoxus]|uniref:acyl carrier protein n=1 Tax=Variovorax paradoxus TaxID=34073 RepID=UPI002789A33B|nr:acyl carrier protein [Variovorax paradoxus]MDP9931812.1 acyl carrier protein [Variovorax paradoxus]MDQ0026009.1 acyl carrier protein [Variovorax paradoxus]
MSSASFSTPVFNSIAAILVNSFDVAPTAIAPGVPLSELGLDSLALMEFVFAVEDAFHLRLPEDKLDPREAGITLQRLCDAIEAQIRCDVEPSMAAPA